jgi:hypothetical protein
MLYIFRSLAKSDVMFNVAAALLRGIHAKNRWLTLVRDDSGQENGFGSRAVRCAAAEIGMGTVLADGLLNSFIELGSETLLKRLEHRGKVTRLSGHKVVTI